jgi:hypothetical protein
MVMSYPGRPPMVPGIPAMPPTMAMPYMQLGGELLQNLESNYNHPYGINIMSKDFSHDVFIHPFIIFSCHLICIYC